MKIKEPENINYSATIIKIKSLIQLEGLDNLVAAPLLGYTALVKKESMNVGDLVVLFVAETQISEKHAHENNLFRHGNFNKDQSIAGYLDDNRRVRAIRLRGNPSNALVMPLESLAWTGIKISELKEGDTFDELNGKEICKKFVKQVKATGPKNVSVVEKNPRVDKKFMPEHIESLNYWRNKRLIKGNTFVTVTQKLHGTSVRIGNTLVNRKLNILEKILVALSLSKIVQREYDSVYGSRKVIKDINNPNHNHFYSTDLWTETGKKLDGILPDGYIVYGEIVGYVGDSPIQKSYTYNLPVGNNELFIYRVAQINDQGIQVDLSWEQVKQFCKNNGLKHVPELWSGRHKNFNVDEFMDIAYHPKFKSALPLSSDSPVDEGICIRAEGITPIVLKAKSPLFLEHETKMLDQEEVDIEEEQKA